MFRSLCRISARTERVRAGPSRLRRVGRAQAAPSIADYAAAVGDLLDSLRLRKVDLLGYQTGRWPPRTRHREARTGPSRIARRHAGIRRAGTRDFQCKPWPARARDDGSHLVEEWQRIRRSRGVHATVARLGEDLAAALRAGDAAARGTAAAANYAAGERLPLVRQPVLLLRPRDEFWDMTGRGEALLREVRRVDLPEQNGGLFDTGSAEVARYAREFLDR